MARSATVREQLEETESALEQACTELRRSKKALKTMKERAETLEKGLLEAREGREAEQDVLIAMQDRIQASHEQHLQDLETIRRLVDAIQTLLAPDRTAATSQKVTALLSSLPVEEPLEGH